MSYKQVILVRTDLDMPPGKMAAQVAHASLAAADKGSKSLLKKGPLQIWKAEGAKKVVLKVETLEELRKYEQLAKQEKLATALITDAGHTVFRGSTITCLGIGPDKEEKIDKVTGKLRML